MNSLATPLRQVQRTFVLHRRRLLSYFGGCDYFRLSIHPRVGQTLRHALRSHGLTVAASRTTTGNHPLFDQLEADLASFFQAPTATLVPTGYTANLIVAQALAGQFTHFLLDDRAHAALQDAALHLRCPSLHFQHRSPKDLARLLHRCGPSPRFLLGTDGLFSHDGSVAPLPDYLGLLPPGSLLLLDDAHGAGVLGPTGQGTLEYLGLPRRRVIQTCTLSKAFGLYGGVILGPDSLRQAILARSSLFRGSTPIPLPLAAAASQALRLLRRDPGFRQRLQHNSHRVKTALRAAGLPLPEHPGPVISLIPKTSAEIARLKRRLLAAGIHPPFINYPGGPDQGYFRFAISSEHTPAQIDSLIAVLSRP